jgi:hypothetical protein
MSNLLILLKKLESKIPYCDPINTSISKSPVSWHIQHTILTTSRIIKALQKSDPINYKWQFNVTRLMIFTFKKIFRGKGQAPKVVIPTEKFEIDKVCRELEDLKSDVEILDGLNEKQFFNHPNFGNLNVKSARKFLEIHTNHHIDIIEDIIGDRKI